MRVRSVVWLGLTVAAVGCSRPKEDAPAPPGAAKTLENIGAAPPAEPPAPAAPADTAAPETTLTSSPSALFAGDPSVLAFVADEPSTFECSVDYAAFAPCTSPNAVAGLGDGPHVFAVRAIDLAGNVDPSPAHAYWQVDRRPPTGRFTTSPPALANTPVAAFGLAANEAVTWSCALGTAPLSGCNNSATYLSLADGTYTFTARAQDLAGNLDPVTLSYSWSIDTVAPDTTIVSSPALVTSSTSATFPLAASEVSATFECRLDGAPFSACPASVVWASLSEGAHTFQARAKDASGNVDPTPALHTWRVDTTGPVIHFSAVPPSLIATNSALVNATAEETPVTWECSLDGAAFSTCTLPRAFSSLLEGPHTFSLRAVDSVGNRSSLPLTGSVTVDLTAPDTTITTKPANGSAGSVTFAFTSSEPGTFECVVDQAAYGAGSTFGACASPLLVSGLSPGSHTFRVRAIDAAGNVDATPALYSWSVASPSTTGAWELRTSTGFAQHPSAWDGVAGQVAVFGGATPQALWHWNGGWVRDNAASPPDRIHGSMVWDSVRNRLVLFGGWVGAPSNDTWEWDGTAWVKRVIAAPPVRNMQAMAFDEARGRVVLFGGMGGSSNTLADTWEYDGTAWTQRAIAGPPGRYQHAMAYDPVRARVVLFGGEDTGSMKDTWEFDGVAWSQRSNNGPAPRFAHAMSWDGNRHRVVLFGGFASGDSADFWEWDGTTWQQINVPGPGARRDHAMAWDPVRQLVVLSGGYTGTEPSEVWEWNGTAWALRMTPPPPRRTDHAMSFDSARGKTVLFGGIDSGNAPLGDTWEWDGNLWNDVTTTPSPSARRHHAMAYDAAHSVTVLFGGREGLLYRGDTWKWNGTTWSNLAVTGPSPRHSHTMVYDSVRARVVLFGGRDGYGIFDETWEWDGSTWAKRAIPGPPARFNHSMAFDVTRGRVVVHGGVGYRGIVFDDTWEYDGLSWSQSPWVGPTVLFDSAMAWDGAHDHVLLYGGTSLATNFDTTWQWTATGWSALTATGPGSRVGHAMVWDSNRSRVVLFGNDWATVIAQTWEFH